MKYLSSQSLLIITLSALVSSTAFAAAGGNGNGNGNAGGVSADLSALEADLAALQGAVQINAEDIAALDVNTVSVDCAADSNALQAAIDAAPAAGAIMNVSGNCNETNIIGRANLLIEGDNSASAGPVGVDASRNIQFANIVLDSLIAENTSSVFFDGAVPVSGAVAVNLGSSAVQLGGSLDVAGEVTAFQSGNFRMNNGSIGGLTLTRNSNGILSTNSNGGLNSIAVNGNIGVYSGAHVLIQAASSPVITDPSGPITVNSGQIWVQRLAALLIAGDQVNINTGFTTVRQNGVLDVINMLQANFITGSLELIYGSGSRFVFSDGPFGPITAVISASCDDSVWTAFHVDCTP